jgi:hypothetical protein
MSQHLDGQYTAACPRLPVLCTIKDRTKSAAPGTSAAPAAVDKPVLLLGMPAGVSPTLHCTNEQHMALGGWVKRRPK